MFTNSRAFLKDGENLTPALIKRKGQYYTLLDHPIIQSFELMTGVDQQQANVEKLNNIGQNFWESAPEVDEETFQGFTQIKQGSFKKIKAADYVAILKLYAHFCGNPQFANNLEVGTPIIIHKETRQLDVIVPEQEVTGGSVDWNILDYTKKVYFLDGSFITAAELFQQYDIVGMAHSHNTLSTFPSSTDNKYEIKDGNKICASGVFFIIGSFQNYQDWENTEPTYETYASIGHNGERVKIPITDLVEEYTEQDWLDWTFDREILKAVKVKTYIKYNLGKGGFTNKSTGHFWSKTTTRRQTPNSKLANLRTSLNHLDPSVDPQTVEKAYAVLEQVVDFLFMDSDEEPEKIIATVTDYFAQFGAEYVFYERETSAEKSLYRFYGEEQDDIFSPYYVDPGT